MSLRGNLPRLLLADDHADLLESVSRWLAPEFQVVGAVSNGRQAVDAAPHLDPDVIVMDITMPDLDGFQALHALRAMGVRARIVFLTGHRTDEYVAAALRAGVHGYVLKMRISSDLVPALHHAVAERQFAPSLTALAAATAGGSHVAHFHLNGRAFLDVASGFARTILRSGEIVVVVGSGTTRAAIARHLQSTGMDLRAMERQQQYVTFDAEEALNQVMRHDRPDPDLLADTVDNLERLRLDSHRGSDARLTVFGEMAVPLCRAGNIEAALEIERIWNRLTRALPIFTVCNYPLECFRADVARERLSSFHSEHRAISHGSDD